MGEKLTLKKLQNEFDKLMKTKNEVTILISEIEKTKDLIKELPNKLNYDVLIPIAGIGGNNFEYTTGGVSIGGSETLQSQPLAFMPGTLIHTNELLAYLGDEWFCELSTMDSVKMLDRKLDKANLSLKNLNEREKLMQKWIEQVEQLKSEKEQFVEIMEEYDEEKEKNWREKHRENVRNHKLKERSLITANSNKLATVVETNDQVEKLEETFEKMTNLKESKESTTEIDQNKPISKFKQDRMKGRVSK